MAHTLLWPTKEPFSPIGSLPAVSLVQDLSPEQPADILLLGCGDPRNILYTLFSDVVTPAGPRKLDITCCDLEPAILARNILLFTLLEDNQPIDQIWDIFYHFKIGNQASATLTRQSQHLYNIAKDIETWQKSLYGSFIKLVDTRTLAQLREYWKSYADFPDLPTDRLDRLLQEQINTSESALKQNSLGMKASLSAGMLWAQVAMPVNKLFKRYWQTGTIFDQDGDVQVATVLNPTFIYSAAGETFDLNSNTFPHGFHLGSAVAPIHSDSSVTVAPKVETAIVDTMMQQFKAWADAFRAARAAEVITLRFYSGEALAFCRALDRFASTSNPVTGVFVSQWCASQIHFDAPNTGTFPAPVAFDVIDTSTLTDSLDILNLLIAARPILKDSTSPQSILYTATDLSDDEQDIIRPVLDRLYTNIPTFSLLLKLAPRDYLSGFTTRSHVHEKLCSDHVKTFYERIAWVDPSGGDAHASQQNIAVSFDAKQLAHVMFGIYEGMFAREQTMVRLMGDRKISLELPFHYIRETMALLLQLLKRRVHLKNGDWDVFGDKFIELIERDRNEIIGPLYYQDICLQLHLYSVHTVGSLKPDWRVDFSPPSPSDIFKDWPKVPPVLCVVFTVPRKELQILLENQDKTGIPTLECHLTARDFHPYAYSSIHAIWGKCGIFGEPETVTLEEDKEGFAGKSDLVVMFWASSRILEFKGTIVSLALKNSTHSAGMFSTKLGQELALYSTPIEDSEHIQILRYQPALANGNSATPENSVAHLPSFEPTSGPALIAANVGSGQDVQHIVSLTARVEIDLPVEQKLLLDGAEVKISHISPCAMRLSIDGHDHTVPYPYPVLSNRYKLRVARKSHYVEVGALVSKPHESGGYHLDRAPVVWSISWNSWNVHHVPIERMPWLNLEDQNALDWIRTQAEMQLSNREYSALKHSSSVHQDVSTKVLASVKRTILEILMQTSGLGGRRYQIITLTTPDDRPHAILFIGALRLDLASFTVVIDAALISPWTEGRPPLSQHTYTNAIAGVATTEEEVAVWKRLLPTFAERCRTWSHKPSCEYLIQSTIPLSLEPKQHPVCSCGQGLGFEDSVWQATPWKEALRYATRVVISPIFAVPYLEASPGGSMVFAPNKSRKEQAASRAQKKSDAACWVCGSRGKPSLAACSRCKQARYCSPSCQQLDWKLHKGGCRSI